MPPAGAFVPAGGRVMYDANPGHTALAARLPRQAALYATP